MTNHLAVAELGEHTIAAKETSFRFSRTEVAVSRHGTHGNILDCCYEVYTEASTNNHMV
eukprot:CAMPEP_0119008584 /NCGR_PEP_ID=MMETSP1176-20130426/3803_1 /TAXON_ID=265551 /ORGANISM="Synedropsis recta cf, Strain CCMP1620" /LENGTH=58 /DNA_ID=CAMNT_0006960945 /DNA_START=255 /DNA_END=431 /DNA_ORIENTATION=+